jgi:hypothetical protein
MVSFLFVGYFSAWGGKITYKKVKYHAAAAKTAFCVSPNIVETV